MSEERVDEFDDIVPKEVEGVFYVSQIAPKEAEEDVKPELKESADGEDEGGEETEEEQCTYQTEPLVAVNPSRISRIAHRILGERLRGKEYSASAMKKAASQISVLMREEIKSLGLDRYRIISHVTVGEKCDQDVLMNFLYLWKPEFDHYVVAKFEEGNFFATALVFLIYKQ